MTLSGRAALERPDVDHPGRLLPPVILRRPGLDERGVKAWHNYLGIGVDGRIDESTGSFTATANAMTEQQRRATGVRRNGRPRRQRA